MYVWGKTYQWRVEVCQVTLRSSPGVVLFVFDKKLEEATYRCHADLTAEMQKRFRNAIGKCPAKMYSPVCKPQNRPRRMTLRGWSQAC